MLTCTREKKLKINTRPVGKFVWGQASRESDPLTEVCCCLTDDRSQVWFLLTTVHVSSDGPLLPDAANRRKQTQWRLSRQRSACFVRLWQRQLQGRAGGKEQINLTHSRWAGVVGWGCVPSFQYLWPAGAPSHSRWKCSSHDFVVVTWTRPVPHSRPAKAISCSRSHRQQHGCD